MEFDWKRLSTLDRVIAAGAVVAFISLFLPWYGASVLGFSATVSGWSAGFSAWAGGLLLTAAGVLVVLRSADAKLSEGRIRPSVLVATVAGLGLLLVIIRWVSFPTVNGVSGPSYSVGARYGIFIALLAGIAELAAAIIAMRASDAPVPASQAAPAEPAAEPEPVAAEPPSEPAAGRTGTGRPRRAAGRGVVQRSSGSSSCRLHSCHEPA